MRFRTRARRCPTCARLLARGRRICPVCALKSRVREAVTDVSDRGAARARHRAERVPVELALRSPRRAIAGLRRPSRAILAALVPLAGLFLMWSTYADSKVAPPAEALCASERLSQMVAFPPGAHDVARDLVGARGRIAFGRPYGVISASLDQFSPVPDDRAYLKYQFAIYQGTCRLDIGDHHCQVTVARDKSRRVDIGARLGAPLGARLGD